MAYNPNNPPGYENMAPSLPTGMTVVNPSSGINLPIIENNDEDVVIKNILKENETTNSYLKEIRDILLKTFDLDKRKFDNELKLQNKQSFTTAETNLEEKPPVTLVDKEGKDKDKKSIFGDNGDGGGLGGLLKAIFGGALVGLVGAILANPDLLVKIYDGIVNLVDMFGKVADWIGTLDSSTIIIASALAAATALFGPIRTLRLALRAATFAARGAARGARGATRLIRGTSGQVRAGTPGPAGSARPGTPGPARPGTPVIAEFEDLGRTVRPVDKIKANVERARNIPEEELKKGGLKKGADGGLTDAETGRALKPEEVEKRLNDIETRATTQKTATSEPKPEPAKTATPEPKPPEGLPKAAANDNITDAAKKILPKERLTVIVAKKAAKVAIKAVPLVGALAGVFFAAERAFAGDWVGATMEGASIPLPSVAGLPVDASIMARDVYMEAYGTKPEEDALEEGGTELVGQRYSAIYDGIKDELQKLAESEDKGKQPTEEEIASVMKTNARNQVRVDLKKLHALNKERKAKGLNPISEANAISMFRSSQRAAKAKQNEEIMNPFSEEFGDDNLEMSKTSMEGPSEPNMMQPTDEVSPKTSMEGPSEPNMTGFAADGMSRVQVNKNVIINNITPTTNNIQQDNSTAVISNSKNGGGGVPSPSNYDDSLFSNAAA